MQGASEARGEVQGGPEPNVKGRLEGGAEASGAFLDRSPGASSTRSCPYPRQRKGAGVPRVSNQCTCKLLKCVGLRPHEVDGKGWRVGRVPRSLGA